MKPRARRELAEWTQQVYELSQRHAARLIPVPRMTLRYQHHRERHEALRVRLRELAGSRVRYGYRRLTDAVAARGLGSERQADLPPVCRGGIDRANTEA